MVIGKSRRTGGHSIGAGTFTPEDHPFTRMKAEKVLQSVWQRKLNGVNDWVLDRAQRVILRVYEDGKYTATEALEVLRMLGLQRPEYVWMQNTTGAKKQRLRLTWDEYEQLLARRNAARERERKRTGGRSLSEAERVILEEEKETDRIILSQSAAEAIQVIRRLQENE